MNEQASYDGKDHVQNEIGRDNDGGDDNFSRNPNCSEKKIAIEYNRDFIRILNGRRIKLQGGQLLTWMST